MRGGIAVAGNRGVGGSVDVPGVLCPWGIVLRVRVTPVVQGDNSNVIRGARRARSDGAPAKLGGGVLNRDVCRLGVSEVIPVVSGDCAGEEVSSLEDPS